MNELLKLVQLFGPLPIVALIAFAASIAMLVFAGCNTAVSVRSLRITSPSTSPLRLLLAVAGVALGGLSVYLLLSGDGTPPRGPEETGPPFRVSTITVLVRDNYNSATRKRHWNVRTIYSVRANQDVANEVLQKRYERLDASAVQPLPGSEHDRMLRAYQTYFITETPITMQNGDDSALVYGARVEFDKPFSSLPHIRNTITLEDNQAWWGFPNLYPYPISAVVLCVESETIDLSFPEHNATVIVTGSNEVDLRGPSRGPSNQVGPAEGALCGKFQDLQPNALAAIVWQWPHGAPIG